MNCTKREIIQMNKIFSLTLILLFFFFSCVESNNEKKIIDSLNCIKKDTVFAPGNTIATRFEVPKGYKRIDVEKGSFGEWLRNLKLKPIGYETHYYNGQIKSRKVAAAVIDMDIDAIDLQQCADAIIRLYAEYLYYNKHYDKISFNFTNGFQCDYLKWANGWRIAVTGNSTNWYKKYDNIDYSYDSFRDYLKLVFMYAGTISLKNQLNEIGSYVDAYEGWENLKVGDIIIKAGSPGHAVIIVDIVEKIDNPQDRMLLLAQSYMPAQEIEILKYYGNEWHQRGVNGRELNTAEWNFIFTKSQFKRF